MGRVLIACEFSGVVRDAFRARGHEAWSCDLLPCERNEWWHIQDDVRNVLDSRSGWGSWDLMIAHPPCTYLANSGARWLFEKEGRWDQLDDGAKFFRSLLNAKVDRIAVENPTPHKWAVERIGRSYDCRIQPWEHGDRQKKGTCFWLKNLPIIKPSNIVGPPPKAGTEECKAWEGVWREPPGPMQAHNRSRTFEGIARALADQWGRLI